MARKKLIKVNIKNPHIIQEVAYQPRDAEIAKRIKEKQKFLDNLLKIENDDKKD